MNQEKSMGAYQYAIFTGIKTALGPEQWRDLPEKKKDRREAIRNCLENDPEIRARYLVMRHNAWREHLTMKDLMTAIQPCDYRIQMLVGLVAYSMVEHLTSWDQLDKLYGQLLAYLHKSQANDPIPGAIVRVISDPQRRRITDVLSRVALGGCAPGSVVTILAIDSHRPLDVITTQYVNPMKLLIESAEPEACTLPVALAHYPAARAAAQEFGRSVAPWREAMFSKE